MFRKQARECTPSLDVFADYMLIEELSNKK
jgi:hypothetical protein